MQGACFVERVNVAFIPDMLVRFCSIGENVNLRMSSLMQGSGAVRLAPASCAWFHRVVTLMWLPFHPFSFPI